MPKRRPKELFSEIPQPDVQNGKDLLAMEWAKYVK